MDPPRPPGMLLAPPPSGGSAARLPGREPFPSVDDHLVAPEVTRDEMLRGRRLIAMPALPPHADRQFSLSYVLGAHVETGYVGSSELLTRVAAGSDFATDACIRREGDDPATSARYLEELAFEVVNEQSPKNIRDKAEDLAARGVRRVFAIFVKTGKVCEWSASQGRWQELDLDATIEDRCLSRPLRVRALLDAAAANDAVAQALADQGNPVIEALKAESRDEGREEGRDEGWEEGLVAGKAAAILAVLAARGLPIDDDARARILRCREAATLDRWIAEAAVAPSAAAIGAARP
jgi:hypothetical protein